MLTLQEFITWLKTLNMTGLYAGYYPKDKTQVIGVYNRSGEKQPEAYGSGSSYKITSLTLLVHWTKGVYETEAKANALYDLLNRAKISTTAHEGWIECKRAPQDVGKDENGVCEYSLDINIYAKKVEQNITTGGNNNG